MDTSTHPPREEKDILEKLADLHLQATTERSHYYTGSVLREAAQTIMILRENLAMYSMAVKTPSK